MRPLWRYSSGTPPPTQHSFSCVNQHQNQEANHGNRSSGRQSCPGQQQRSWGRSPAPRRRYGLTLSPAILLVMSVSRPNVRAWAGALCRCTQIDGKRLYRASSIQRGASSRACNLFSRCVCGLMARGGVWLCCPEEAGISLDEAVTCVIGAALQRGHVPRAHRAT
jgi:hypothetical protein